MTAATTSALSVGCSASPAVPGPASPEAPGTAAAAPPSLQRYTYGDLPSQYVELTVPPGEGPFPVVVVVHGGFWQTPYGADLGAPLAADLVTRGWATANLEYRRVGGGRTSGGGGWPRTGEDVAAAVDALAEQGQQVAGGRLDLDRVVGLGHSAGGQLAGWLAARPGLPASAPGANPRVSLTGLVAQAGVMDLVGAAREEVGGDAVQSLMGGEPDRHAEAYAQASPMARLPLGIASVAIHGESDSNVPISQSERFVDAARKAGDPSELQRFDGDHFDLITVGTPAWTLCVEAVARLI